jgi:hypothetical protein
MGDIKQRLNRHHHRRLRYRRRYRCSETKVERKMKNVKAIVSHGKQERGWGCYRLFVVVCL